MQSRPPRFRGKAEANGIVRANKFHPTCRGIGDGMYAMGTSATREVPAVIAVWINWQLARDRPGRVGCGGLAVPMKRVTPVEGRGLS